jgi:large subunit ribosomal protein L29
MAEIQDLTTDELEHRLADLQEELFNLRFQYATRQLTNHARIRDVRRDIARIRTLMRQHELGEMGA